MTGPHRSPACTVLLLVATAACGAPDESIAPEVLEAMGRIRPEAIEEHMRRLSDDALEGRATGTRGYLEAAGYVSRRFQETGLQGAGDDGGFFQTVPLRGTRLIPGASAMELVREDRVDPLEIGSDFLLRGDFVRERAELTAPVAFVGFGVVAPECERDDYAGVDVNGKIVAFYRGAPSSLPHDQRAYCSSSSLKYRNAVERGAVGVLELLLPDDRRRVSWDRLVRQSKTISMRWVDTDGKPRDAFPELFVVGRLSESGERALFEGAPTSRAEAIAATEAGRPASFDLPVALRVTTASERSRAESPNVIGLLPGSDPELGAEYVVITAHLDHLGVVEMVGDGIHNGAYDNASGVAILIEIARAFAILPVPPRRSMLFLAVTGEEKGLLGSEYFLSHSAVPVENIVADVNLDMVLMLHPLVDLVAFGAEHSSLYGQVETATSRLGIEMSPDPIPEEVLFIRSDQFPFVRRGIPSLFTISGFETPEPSEDGMAVFREWMLSTYHSPRDDMSQKIDFEAGVEFARVNFLVGHLVADGERRPAWNRGDFFGEKFGRRDAR